VPLYAGCNKSFLDHVWQLEQLPVAIRNLLPTSRSEKTGISALFADIITGLVPTGVSFNQISKLFQSTLLTAQARKELGFYSMLVSAIRGGTLKQGQVCRVAMGLLAWGYGYHGAMCHA
jgi:hypothetical protein